MLNCVIELRSGMGITHEDIVTRILSKCEIINVNFQDDDLKEKMFVSNPLYDLTHFLKTAGPEPSRWGAKYIFVK